MNHRQPRALPQAGRVQLRAGYGLMSQSGLQALGRDREKGFEHRDSGAADRAGGGADDPGTAGPLSELKGYDPAGPSGGVPEDRRWEKRENRITTIKQKPGEGDTSLVFVSTIWGGFILNYKGGQMNGDSSVSRLRRSLYAKNIANSIVGSNLNIANRPKRGTMDTESIMRGRLWKCTRKPA